MADPLVVHIEEDDDSVRVKREFVDALEDLVRAWTEKPHGTWGPIPLSDMQEMADRLVKAVRKLTRG